MIGTYTATELEATIWGRLDEDPVREPSDEQIGRIIQEVVAPGMFDHLEWGINTQNIVFEALAKAHQRELENEERLRA